MFCSNLYYDFKQLHSFVVFLFPSTVIKQALNAQSVLNIRYFYFSKANKQKSKNEQIKPTFVSKQYR